jgi:rod shape-determining protein MreD
MFAHIGLAFLVYVAAAAQAVLAPRLAMGGAEPEPLLLAALAASLAVRGWPAIVWAAVAGLIGDCLSERPLGIEMLIATIVVLFVQRALHTKQDFSTWFGGCVCTAAIATIVLSRETVAAAITSHPISPGPLLAASTTAAVYSTLVGVLLYGIWHTLRGVTRRVLAPAD